ncbi:hypothetical protein M3Y94_00220900 [Aphelenchoides besseyi]|nr:hypothetical protein M3Y94_00220900 [Aphelenchoides besseyi]KAI6236532.1 hypothetical protein M3Y95_00167700 [Aphelenchoides besseyi]
MIPLNRLSSWRQRISRLCGLSHSTSARHRRDQSEDEMDQPVEMQQNEALRDFIERVQTLEKNKYFNANVEFAKLRTAQENFQSQEEFSMSDGFSAIQNRYRDVVPYNKNRIRLKENDSSSDYINASMIEYPNVSRRYIAAQAPLSGNIDDFWHMIGQYQIRVVAMLCKVVENSLVKCVQYWPFNVGEKMELGFGSLETVKVDHFDDFSIREIHFKSKKFGDSIVYQLHYTEWPDHGCPDSELHIPKFIEAMDKYQTEHGGDAPILVHCSAGCGRTGTVIGVDIIRILINENKIAHQIDLKGFVLELRKQRTSFVQSASQYTLLYTLVAHYCKLALGKAKTPEPTADQNNVQLVGSNEQTTAAIPQNGSTINNSKEQSMAADGNEEHELIDLRM